MCENKIELNEDLEIALIEACCKSDLIFLQQYVNTGINLNHKFYDFYPISYANNGSTLLHIAVYENQFNVF